MNPMTKTAVIYARVSSTRQADDGLPIASQIEQAELKAELLGAQVLKVFKDEGISGRSAEKRPAFQDAIAFCAAFDVEYFICWSTSRFARNKIDAASYKKLLADGNTKLVYVTSDIDEDTDEGWFTGSLLEIVDEHYSRVVSRDTRRSMMKNARDGFFNGGRIPYGYTPVAEGKRRRLQINESEAQTIRDIFNLCLVGMGSKAIAMKLNETGQLKNGKKWDKNIVSLVLKNPVYAGLTVFNRTNNAGNNRPIDEWIITPSHAGIITQDLFDNAQILIGQRAPASEGGSPHSNFVFTGILRCGDCGAAMPPGCSAVSVPATVSSPCARTSRSIPAPRGRFPQLAKSRANPSTANFVGMCPTPITIRLPYRLWFRLPYRLFQDSGTFVTQHRQKSGG